VGKGGHYFTDTVGGAAVGTAVVLATALALDWLMALSRLTGSGYQGAGSGPMADTAPSTPAEARATGCTITGLTNGVKYGITVVTHTTIGDSGGSYSTTITPHSGAA
jgi:hypothetical protein